MSAAGVVVSMASCPEAGPGASPRAALHDIRVAPIPHRIARALLERHHYTGSIPGGSVFRFGVFVGIRLQGVIILGAGPAQAYRLVEGARHRDGLTLTRVWLSDTLPQNSESKVIGIVLRALKRNTDLRFIVSYADPARGHVGTIYQAGGWLYTGLSQGSSLCDLGDGKLRHTRTIGFIYGTHSARHFEATGAQLKPVPQPGKHRYIYLLDRTWRERLLVPVLPYPKKETAVK